MSKAAHYSVLLDTARAGSLFHLRTPVDPTGKLTSTNAAGQAAAPVPGAKGEGMSWDELVRKFKKHTGRDVTAAAALVDETLHHLVQKAADGVDYHLDTSQSASLPSATSPPKLSWAPLIQKEDRPSALKAIESLETTIRAGKGSELEKNSARIIVAWGLYQVGDFKAALGELSEVEKGTPEGMAWERYDCAVRVLANTVEGYANERMGNVSAAMKAYNRAGRVYGESCDLLAKTGSVKSELELHTHGEDALFRLSLWSRSNSISASPYPAHRLYTRQSRLFLPSFRPTKAIIIHESFRALLHSTGPTVGGQEWHSEVASNNLGQEKMLKALTTLPMAGEVNKPYLKFLDEVFAGWKIGGAGRDGAKEVVEIMYNALTHTFQSQRLLRYLIRALTARGSHVEAGKALHLYVDLFDKARETDAAQVARDVRKFRVGSVATEAEKFKEKYRSESDDGHGENGTADVAVDEEDFDIDADREFVETMVFGVRLACKYLEDPKGGLKLAKRARAIFDEGKDKSLVADKLVESRVERALGVALGALASKEADLETRPDDHALALAHLESAVALDPTSWETLYHLSYQLAELRQITPALDAARSAVALNNGSKESWHLLGLLVAAQKDLGASLQVLETALDDEVTGPKPATNGNGDDDDDDDDDDDEEVPVRASKNRPRGASFVGRPAPRSNKSTESLVTLETAAAPSKTSSFNAPRSAEANFEYPQDETERLATEVQIRMTKNVVIEAMEGPEAALLDQQSLLAYFSLALATVRDGPVGSTSNASALLSTGDGTTASRRASVSKRQSVRTTNGETSTLARAMSTKSRHSTVFTAAAESIAPTLPAPSVGGISLENNPRATKLLIDLWLMSAASYRRAGRLDECRGAIQEAEVLDADDPDVWCQFAQYSLAIQEPEQARTSLIKALSYSADHIASLVLLSRFYLLTPSKLPFAEGLLDTLTQNHGWDVAEAWYELSRCYKGTGRERREKECLVWALQLEETRSVRSLRCCPRLL